MSALTIFLKCCTASGLLRLGSVRGGGVRRMTSTVRLMDYCGWLSISGDGVQQLTSDIVVIKSLNRV